MRAIFSGLVLVLAPCAFAIRCHEILQSQRANPLTFEPLNNPDANMPLDIININDCMFRFQNTNDNAPTPNEQEWMDQIRAARVTQAQWRQTPQSVETTLMDGWNTNGGNSQIWLSPAVDAFLYIGVLNDNKFKPGKDRLFQGDTVVSMILPSGVNKLQPVFPLGNDPEIQGAAQFGITGISGDLDPSQDYAYVLLGEVISSLRARYKTRLDLSRTVFGPGYLAKPWFLAEKADGTCIVVDVRQMPTFMVYTGEYPNAEVCNYSKRRWTA